jgi:hypothetical protein
MSARNVASVCGCKESALLTCKVTSASGIEEPGDVGVSVQVSQVTRGTTLRIKRRDVGVETEQKRHHLCIPGTRSDVKWRTSIVVSFMDVNDAVRQENL